VVENLGKSGTGEDLNRCGPTKKFVLIGGIGVISSGFAGHLNGYKKTAKKSARCQPPATFRYLLTRDVFCAFLLFVRTGRKCLCVDLGSPQKTRNPENTHNMKLNKPLLIAALFGAGMLVGQAALISAGGNGTELTSTNDIWTPANVSDGAHANNSRWTSITGPGGGTGEYFNGGTIPVFVLDLGSSDTF
jgi:hypothetical protein